jgi:hypothetical protein
MYDPAFQCVELGITSDADISEDNKHCDSATHNEALIEREHYDEFDREKLCHRPFAFQFGLRQ